MMQSIKQMSVRVVSSTEIKLVPLQLMFKKYKMQQTGKQTILGNLIVYIVE